MNKLAGSHRNLAALAMDASDSVTADYDNPGLLTSDVDKASRSSLEEETAKRCVV
jgi:hypothetical protein